MNRRLRDGLFAAAGLLVLSAAALFGTREEAPPRSVPSIADDGSRGAAAFALLLSREGFKTAAYRRRMTELRDSPAALVLLGTPDDAAEPPTRGETDALAVWVRRGGHLLVAGNPVDDATLRKIAGFSTLNLKRVERRARAGAGLSHAAFAPREIAGRFERGIRTPRRRSLGAHACGCRRGPAARRKRRRDVRHGCVGVFECVARARR